MLLIINVIKYFLCLHIPWVGASSDVQLCINTVYPASLPPTTLQEGNSLKGMGLGIWVRKDPRFYLLFQGSVP